MLCRNLATIVGLIEIVLTVCLLLLSTTEIDSKSNIRNQVTTFKPEGNTVEDNLTPKVVMNNKTTTKKFLKRTPRKKRNFVGMVKKYCNLSISTAPSTCTPFFIRRSKMAHRKTTRLKNPLYYNTIQANTPPTNDSLQKKCKIKKLFFSKHTSTPLLFVSNSSELLTGKNKNKCTTTNILNLSEPLSDKTMFDKSVTTGMNTDGFNFTADKNITCIHPESTKHPLSTSGIQAELPISEITDNYLTSFPFTDVSISGGNLRTRENQIEGSTINLTNMTITTTNSSNSFGGKANVTVKTFQIKNIFPFKKALSFVSSKLDQTPRHLESGQVLQHYNTSGVTEPISNKTTKNVISGPKGIKKKLAITFLPKNTFQSKNNHLPIHHKQKNVSIKIFANKPKEFSSTEPVIKNPTNNFITQIPSNPILQTVNKEYNNNESNLSTVTSLYYRSSENGWKHMHFDNMLHRQQKTTLDKVISPTELEKNYVFKSEHVDSSFVTGSSITSLMTQDDCESKTDAHSRENENLITRLFNFKKKKIKEESGSNYSTFESTAFTGKEVLDHISTVTTSDPIINSYDNSNIREENDEITTIQSPFKIKYLMRFRSPISSTQSGYSNSTWTDLTSSKTCKGKKGLASGEEHVPLVEINTKSMATQENLRTDTRTSKPLDSDLNQCKLNKNSNTIAATSLTNTFSLRGKNKINKEKFECGESKLNTLQSEETKGSLKFKDFIGLRKHKTHCKNKKHKPHTRKPIHSAIRVSRKPACCYKQSTEDNFKEKFDITFYSDNTKNFRDWFFGKTKPANNPKHNNEEECTFRWCFKPLLNGSISTSNMLSTFPLTPITPETPVNSATFSSIPPEKKLKNFFHFKTSHMQSSEYNSMAMSVSDYTTKDLSNHTITKPIQPNEATMKEYVKIQTLHGNTNDSHMSSSRSTSGKPVPLEVTSIKSPSKTQHQFEIVTVKSDLNSSDIVEKNVSIKVYGHGKIKQFIDLFHTPKMHSSSNELNWKNKEKNSSKKANGTVILNQEYADYIETKVETKKHRKYSNRTVLHNASDVNDTSFNVMAYVMKPFDSLVSVFKAHSPTSVTKIGDVNATDIKNGSLPNHLQPPNSSIVIVAVNNTNATSKDIHESKLGMALDLIGGMYHCVFNSFVEARPEDVRFYLYTRSNPDEYEELFLPPEPSLEEVTDSNDLPQPVLEEEMTSEMPMDKREIESDENCYEDYEFEALNPAKSEIHSKWFNVRAETKVLIHGYLQDYQTDIMVSMKEAYLSRGPYNVVVVDWSVLVGDSSCYPVVASRGLRQVGGLLAHLLNRLVEAGVSPSSIHIVGFSLGAHVAGHAGTFLSHGLVSRITGLDPALPYVPMAPDVSLNSDDALFVDIIHSAAGLLGQSGPMGHVDFYPNGGSQQPGCEVSSLSCSHRRAALYFIESINSDSGFQATKCESWHHFQADNCSYPAKVLMGEPCPNTRGKYYLVTGYRSPFALQPDVHVKVKKSLLLDLFYDSEDL